MQKKIGFYIVFLLIFVSNDSLSLNLLFENNSNLVKQIVYIVTIIFMLLFCKKLNYKKVSIGSIVFSIFILSIFATVLTNSDFRLGYVVQFIVLYIGYIVTRRIRFDVFVNEFNRMLYYLSLISITMFLIFSIFPNSTLLFPIYSNIEDVSYINLFFYVHYIDMFRNTGVFREPGVYMIFLNIGLMFELLYFNKLRKKYVIIFIITLLTTLSTAGFIILGIVIFLYLLKKRSIKVSIQFLFLGSLLSVFVAYNSIDLFEKVFDKFDSQSVSHDSLIARTSSVYVPFMMFLEAPFTGVGLSTFMDSYKYYAKDLFGIFMVASGSSTNTLMNLLATYGIIFFILLNLSLYKISTFFSKNKIIRCLVFLSFLLMLSNEDLRYSLFFSILLFYGLNSDYQNLFKRK